MVESRRNRVALEMETEQPGKIVSMEYDGYTCLIRTKKESPASMQVEVDKELPYLNLDFNEENIVQAMVYSEIFGKPKSKRRKRW